MDMRGSTCIRCREKFHNCSSCEPDTAKNNGYCGDKCFQASDQLGYAKKNAQELYDSLNDTQKEQFEKFQSDIIDFADVDLYKEDTVKREKKEAEKKKEQEYKKELEQIEKYDKVNYERLKKKYE